MQADPFGLSRLFKNADAQGSDASCRAQPLWCRSPYTIAQFWFTEEGAIGAEALGISKKGEPQWLSVF